MAGQHIRERFHIEEAPCIVCPSRRFRLSGSRTIREHSKHLICETKKGGRRANMPSGPPSLPMSLFFTAGPPLFQHRPPRLPSNYASN